MSNNQQPKPPPPTIPQIAGIFGSLTQSANEILSGNKGYVAEIRNLYTSFLTSPTTIKILGFNPTIQPPNPPNTDTLHQEILGIKKTITALSKAVSSAQKPATQKATPPPTNTPTGSQPQKKTQKTSGVIPMLTYASKAATPLRPSAVVTFRGTGIPEPCPTPAELCRTLIMELADSRTHAHIRISAAKWNARGNIIVTAGPDINSHTFHKSLDYITKILNEIVFPANISADTRPNVKWSRVLLNRVPTGTTDETEAHSTHTSHQALLRENPSYAALTITQQPSWVKNPATYTPGAVSSLSFAFEDPDGSQLAHLLSIKELNIFGTSATIKKWKQKPPQKKPEATPCMLNPTAATPAPATLPDTLSRLETQALIGRTRSSGRGSGRPSTRAR